VVGVRVLRQPIADKGAPSGSLNRPKFARHYSARLGLAPVHMTPGELKMRGKLYTEELKIEAMNLEQVVNMTICWFKPL